MRKKGYAAQQQWSWHGEVTVIPGALRIHIARQVLGHPIAAVEMLIANRPRPSVSWLLQPPAMPFTKISGHNMYGAQKIVIRAAGVHWTRKSRALSTMYAVVLFPEKVFFDSAHRVVTHYLIYHPACPLQHMYFGVDGSAASDKKARAAFSSSGVPALRRPYIVQARLSRGGDLAVLAQQATTCTHGENVA